MVGKLRGERKIVKDTKIQEGILMLLSLEEINWEYLQCPIQMKMSLLSFRSRKLIIMCTVINPVGSIFLETTMVIISICVWLLEKRSRKAAMLRTHKHHSWPCPVSTNSGGRKPPKPLFWALLPNLREPGQEIDRNNFKSFQHCFVVNDRTDLQ